MTKYINLEVLPNKNLSISLNTDKDIKEDLTELIELYNTGERDHVMIWLDLLEHHSCNDVYSYVMPEKIGALTDSPIIGYEAYLDEDGEIEENEDTKYWWFPNYMVTDELDELFNNGSVIFEAAN